MAALTTTQLRRARPTLPEFAGEAAVYRHPTLGDFPAVLTGREFAPNPEILFFEVRLTPGGLTWIPASCLYLVGGGDRE